MRWSCDSTPYSPFSNSNIQWIIKSDIKSFYKVKSESCWKLFWQEWQSGHIYVRASAQVPQTDLYSLPEKQDWQRWRQPRAGRLWEAQKLRTSFEFTIPHRPECWFWPACWGFPQHQPVQGRKACSHWVSSSIAVLAGQGHVSEFFRSVHGGYLPAACSLSL